MRVHGPSEGLRGGLTCLFLLAGAAVVFGSGGASAYTNHAPITIDGDAAFIAANGVTGGNGTWDDPFLIEGWEIAATTDHGIEIRNTNAYFVVRGVYVHSGGSAGFRGISFFNVDDGRVENSTITDNGEGVRAVFATNVTIAASSVAGNDGAGITFRWSTDSTVSSTSVTGNGGVAITFDRVIGAAVLDSAVSDNGAGVEFLSTAGCAISGTSVTGNRGTGIDSSFSTQCSVTDATVADNADSAALFSRTENTTITASTFAGNGAGLGIEASTNATLTNNTFVGEGVRLDGTELAHFNSHSIPAGNLVNGLPLRFYKDSAGVRVDALPTGELLAANVTDLVASNLTIADTDTAIQLAFANGVRLEGNTIGGGKGNGILVYRATGVSMTSNYVVNNRGGGVSIIDSADLAFADNTVSYNGFFGLSLESVTNGTITSNALLDNPWKSLSLFFSFGLLVQGNSFIDHSNRLNVVDGPGSPNTFDAGYPEGGNYWSEYTGVDVLGGPGQDQPGSDGIGDAPYFIDSNSRDVYPLMTSALVDEVPPTLAIASPSPGEATSLSSIDVTGIADDRGSGVARVESRTNGGSWLTALGTASWSFTADLAPGANLLEVRAWDVYGNPSTIASISVTYDTVPPPVTLAGPADNATVPTPTVQVSGTTEPGATVIVNGLLVAVSPNGSFAFPLALFEGENVIQVSVRDPAGNEGTATVRVRFSPPPPEDAIGALPPGIIFAAPMILAAGAALLLWTARTPSVLPPLEPAGRADPGEGKAPRSPPPPQV